MKRPSGAAQSAFESVLERIAVDEDFDVEVALREDPAIEPELRMLWDRHLRLERWIDGALPRHGEDLAGGPCARFDASRLFTGGRIGEYELLELLGQGGMGQVWRARQASLGRVVALKTVRPDRVTPETLDFFAREARAGGRLSHPGIVAVHAHGGDRGVAWIAMELVEDARTLREHAESRAHANASASEHHRELADLVLRVARALEEAHASGVIHRDVKPQNILVDREGAPRVTDFGLARIVDETALSVAGDVAGTYSYMSPEQVRGAGASVDHRTDVFSLGVVLYELLTSRRPFEGDTVHQVTRQILEEDPPPPHRVRSRVPRDLSTICLRCLEKNPDRRYATMAELAEDLERFLAHEPIHARPPSGLRRAALWARRNPTRATALIAGLALLGVTSGFVVELRREIASVKRLSALHEYTALIERAGELWPAHPDRLEELRDWERRARALVAEREVHVAKLRAIEARGTLDEAGALRFPDTEQGLSDAWWAASLRTLVDSIDGLLDPRSGLLSAESEAVSREHGWSIPRRIRFAERLAAGFEPGGEWHEAWADVIPRVSEAHRELVLPPQMGLVPIGTDPDSGLFEFWHVASGERPARDEEGRMVLDEDMGLVFVLLPSAMFWMGATTETPAINHDPAATHAELPVHEVVLDAFLVSKYELTQGQFARLAGFNPSRYGPDANWLPTYLRSGAGPSFLQPVEKVSWYDAVRVLDRAGLALPTEAQWERACRAGSVTPWSTGLTKKSLEGYANVSDVYAKSQGAKSFQGMFAHVGDWFDDGAFFHAPIGSYRPNRYGLHDLYGNVAEWCRDAYDPEFYARSPRENPLCTTSPFRTNVTRGASFARGPNAARTASRYNASPEHGYAQQGVRPVFEIVP